MQVSISAYQQRFGRSFTLTPIVPGLFAWSASSGDLGKARQRLIERVRKELVELPLAHLGRLMVPAGRKLTREHLELTLREDGEKERLSGFFPVVVEDRPAGGDRVLRIAYHPLRPAAWFEPAEGEELGVGLARHYSRTFEPSDDLNSLRSQGDEKLVTLRFQVDSPDLVKRFKPRKRDEELASAGRSGDLAGLLRVAVNQSARAANGTLRLGMVRERERERLRQLLCGSKKSSVVLVGPPGCGKSTLIAQAVQDLLDADDFASHRNLDRVHNVIAFGGRQLIAGMSYVGQWEARSVELLAHAKKRRKILWIDDISAFPSIGKTTVSDRTLADFFAGPLARGDLVVVAECTREQWSALQHDAPALAAAFQVLHVEATSSVETLAMLLFETRRLEEELDVAIEPRALNAIIEQSTALSSGTSLPGRALLPLVAIARTCAQEVSEAGDLKTLGVDQVLRFFSAQTGLPELLLSSQRPLFRAELERELSEHVAGQPVAIEAACDLILSLRTRLCGPNRPYGVYLFTGPTGTGKTELAKCIAEYLYGTPERMLRFDMGELGTPDAVARLIGDQFEPDGLLTSRMRAQPFSLLLFDEVEKAHPSVLNLMLQIFEDARLCDARGNVTDFSHAVIVLTSNLGSGRAAVRGFAPDAAAEAADIARAVREFFPPELFNRIDRVVPFGPLDVRAARDIVRKELAKLTARPGLSERNTFVRFTEAVVGRVVDDGYNAEYGARSLKRYVDREVGDALTSSIVTDAPAEMRLAWMFAEKQSAGIGIRSEALREAEPHPVASRVLPLLTSSYDELGARIPAALEELARFDLDGRLPELAQRLSDELSRYRLGERGRASEVFNIDALRAHALTLTARIEARLRDDPKLEAEERRRKLARGAELDEQDFTTLGADHARAFEPNYVPRVSASETYGGTERARALLHDLAEASFLDGLLRSASEPDRHVAVVEVLKLSLHPGRRRFSKGNPGLGEWLAETYARARGELDAVAVGFWDGSARSVPVAELDEVLTLRPKQVVLRVIGPGVVDFLQGETGCQVRRTLTSGPEIVRVRVVPGHHEPLAWVDAHRESLKAFELSLESDAELASNPEELLPVLRSLRFDPEPGQLALLRVEDFRLSYVGARRVRRLAELYSELLLLGAGTR